ALVSKAFHDLRQLREKTDKACSVYDRMVADLDRQRGRIRGLSAALGKAEDAHAKLAQQLHELDISAVLQGSAQHIPILIESLSKPQDDFELSGKDLEEAEG
ncbi:unnamed protein product, partial [Prorocentrum cordatum]